MTSHGGDRVTGRQPRRKPGYRYDIQGLRAVAVVSVALGHAHLGAFSGGYVGVDVFFVISGFLITQLLLAEAQHTGRISLLGFYARRAKRILPAATLVIIATLLASVLFLGVVPATSVVRDAVWATFFAANIKFGRDNTSYFAADNPASPLQHYWSLSVEEQFYLVWPLLLACLLGAVWLLRRRRYQPRHVSPRPSRGADGRLLAALGIIGAASLAWSITLTAGAPSGAYFSTLARVWELVAGASCAVLLPTISRLPAAAMRALTWAGVVCIGMAVFGYDATTPFPGYAALCPVVGAMLVIAGGSRARSLPTSLLGSRPLRWVGDASYSFYLWHWPFLVVAAGYVGHPLPAYQNLLVVTAALALSVLTYRYVENPFRRARLPLLTRRRGVALYPVAIAATLVTCMVADHLVHREVAEAASNPGIEMHQRGSTYHGTSYAVSPTVRRVRASVAAARHDQAVPGDLRPGLLDLRASIPDVGECDYLEDVHRLCKRGAKGEDDGGDDKVIVLFGDSHARSWIPAVDVVAKQRGWSAYYLVRPACTEAAITPDRVKGAGARDECLSWRQWAMDEIGQLHPDVTVLTSYVPRGVVKPDGDVAHDDHEVAAMFGTGLRETIDDLRDHTGRLVLVGDVPGVKEPTGECLGGRGATLGDCASPPSARGELMRDTTQRVAKRAGVPYIDPTPWFCFDDLCPSVIGSFVAYRDSEHISVPYSRHLSDVLGDALLPSRSR